MRDSKGRFIKGHEVPIAFRNKIRKSNIKLGNKPPSRKGIPSSEFQKIRASENHTGRKDSDKTRLKRIASARRGSMSHFWRGGVTPINLAIRMSNRYKIWRRTVFERDFFTCVLCEKKGGKLNADHIRPLCILIKENLIKSLKDAYSCEDIWDLKNGRTLCVKCHKKTDTFGLLGRKKYDY